MPRIYILLMSVLISAFYACDHRGKPYPATLLQIESLADTNPDQDAVDTCDKLWEY